MEVRLDIPTIIVIAADEHAGGTTGLMKPGWRSLEGNDKRELTTTQGEVWRMWKKAWHTVHELRKEYGTKKKMARLIVVNNGDAIDGNHHGTKELSILGKEEQGRAFNACFLWALKFANFDQRKGDQLHFVNGTESHVGQEEETIARGLIDDELAKGYIVEPKTLPTVGNEWLDGQFVHDKLSLDINDELWSFQHHGASVGARAWTKENGLRARIKSDYFTRMLQKRRPISHYIYSHNHQYISAPWECSQTGFRLDGSVTPSFQTKTHYGYKVAGRELGDIGLLMFASTQTKRGTRVEKFCEFERYEEDEVKVI